MIFHNNSYNYLEKRFIVEEIANGYLIFQTTIQIYAIKNPSCTW